MVLFRSVIWGSRCAHMQMSLDDGARYGNMEAATEKQSDV